MGAAGGVVDARGIARKRFDAAGGVAAAHGIAQKRVGAAGGVDVARGIVPKRRVSKGRVMVTVGVLLQGSPPARRVPVGVARRRVRWPAPTGTAPQQHAQTDHPYSETPCARHIVLLVIHGSAIAHAYLIALHSCVKIPVTTSMVPWRSARSMSLSTA